MFSGGELARYLATQLALAFVVILAIGVLLGLGGSWLWENFPTISIEWGSQ